MPNKLNLSLNYGKVGSLLDLPNLIEIQKKHYEDFLQLKIPAAERKNHGLEKLFRSFFPIESNSGAFVLEYVSYDCDMPVYDVASCKNKGITYSVLLKLKIRLIEYKVDNDIASREVKDVKEQEIYMADFPLMTEGGTFVVNGAERVIVSQIHRSQGVFITNDKNKLDNDKGSVVASIVPGRGSWLDFEFDSRGIIYVRVDKKSKINLVTFLRCLGNDETVKYQELVDAGKEEFDINKLSGMSSQDILKEFYNFGEIKKVENGWEVAVKEFISPGNVFTFDLVNAKDSSVLLKAGSAANNGLLKKLEKIGIEKVIVPSEGLLGLYVAEGVFSEKSGEEIVPLGASISNAMLDIIEQNEIESFKYLILDTDSGGSYIVDTLYHDKSKDYDRALSEVYKAVFAAEVSGFLASYNSFRSLFMKEGKYDLSVVGRMKINKRYGFDTPMDRMYLTKQDIFAVVKQLIRCKMRLEPVDDIDHLYNRRVRSVGELLEEQVRMGLFSIEKGIRERLNANVVEKTPQTVVNVKSLQKAVMDFFATSQLSQFMDQTNPLSEITHKRRLSALGPGGLTRERAGFEVRDVHTSHYGRICPIETPEGPNIGLINSLASYARTNEYGFLEAPFAKVEEGKVLKQIDYLDAEKESVFNIAQASTPVDENGKITSDVVVCRLAGEMVLRSPEEVDYIDSAPSQIVSVAASLVPFLENDDANRALMGANMQRQAVPLLLPEAPIVGTGIEGIVAKDSGVCIVAEGNGKVLQVDSSNIVVNYEEGGEVVGMKIYKLSKFQRSNNNTCVNQKPNVKLGDFVKKGDVIADGPAVKDGELALGKNVLVAFMPWNGYNFEDSILVSERIVKDDVFTSLHIEEFEVVVRDTKLGMEEITADIPNISKDSLAKLDESGIVFVGANVKSGDVLVGKVTPKADGVITPEEKVLRAIFGEKASMVKDASLKVPPGVEGTVVGVYSFLSRGAVRDKRSQIIERKLIDDLISARDDSYKMLERAYKDKLLEILDGHKVSKASKDLKKGDKLGKDIFANVPLSSVFAITVEDDGINKLLVNVKTEFDRDALSIKDSFAEKIELIKRGDDLPAGVVQTVKVFIATKRRLRSGDKMAGRHGNKGVVSRIVSVEDMPYLEDGTPVDICLNPLGVPSRMNIGQVLETHFGWTSYNIGKQVSELIDSYYKGIGDVLSVKNKINMVANKDLKKVIDNSKDEEILDIGQRIVRGVPVAVPVFGGVSEKDIDDMLEIANLDKSAQVQLIDGRTGEPFHRKATVGYMYMFKLHHLVDNKIHARSVGPYSLITQQPLGGKAQFGGQRFGEMEVWAVQAYGAAYTLQEMLTVKSDDQAGRIKVYESIIQGEDNYYSGVPESFNVLSNELRSLCLDIKVKYVDSK